MCIWLLQSSSSITEMLWLRTCMQIILSIPSRTFSFPVLLLDYLYLGVSVPRVLQIKLCLLMYINVPPSHMHNWASSIIVGCCLFFFSLSFCPEPYRHQADVAMVMQGRTEFQSCCIDLIISALLYVFVSWLWYVQWNFHWHNNYMRM